MKTSLAIVLLIGALVLVYAGITGKGILYQIQTGLGIAPKTPTPGTPRGTASATQSDARQRSGVGA